VPAKKLIGRVLVNGKIPPVVLQQTALAQIDPVPLIVRVRADAPAIRVIVEALVGVVVVAVEAVAVVEVVVVVVGDKEAVCWLIELLPKEIFFGEKKQIKVGE